MKHKRMSSAQAVFAGIGFGWIVLLAVAAATGRLDPLLVLAGVAGVGSAGLLLLSRESKRPACARAASENPRR